MSPYSYAKQIRGVLLIELTIIGCAFAIAYGFWTNVCSGTLESCVADGPVLGPLTFLALCAVRPLAFTPLLFIAILGGNAFGTLQGTILTTVGSVFSCLLIFGITKYLGHRIAKPWLRTNLPATFKFIRSQDYKVVFALRLIPILPFDLLSIVFGALDFRMKSVAIATLVGVIPEAYMFSTMLDPNVTLMSNTIITLSVLALCFIVPLLMFEFLSRKRGSGMWQVAKAMYREITYEVQINNDIVKRHQFDPNKVPVLLLYGFFSSRRAVTVLERMLLARGHQVLSFNLGGLLGTFFTRGILDTAQFVEHKLKRQIDRHGFEKIHIVAHSKGGLVALWWLLILGGHKHCDKVITMGTPFSGTLLTYFALITPLGFFWRDMWQMRPGSSLIKQLKGAPIPSNVQVYCLHSHRDKVATGSKGLFKPRQTCSQIHSIPMDHVAHFEFLYRRDVGDLISKLLKSPGNPKESGNPQSA